jgi:integrase
VTYRGKPKKASTIAVDRGRIQRHILPLLGSRKLRDLTTRDISRFISDVASGSTATDVRTKPRGRAIVEGGPGAARRTTGLLGGMLTYAVQLGIIDGNPVRGVDRQFADRRNLRALSSEELKRLGEVLSASGPEGQRESSTAVALILFIALTGFRKGEALWLRRTDIDEGHGAIRLADSKSGPQLRAVGRPVVELLRSIPVMPNTDLVFWGAKAGVPFIGVDKVFKRFCSQTGIGGASLHTLRHTFASVAGELGLNEFTIAALLGHRAGSITGRYVHIDRTLVTAADRVSCEIMARLQGEGTEQGGEIIQFAVFDSSACAD